MIHAWWQHHEAADSLAITACGLKLAEGDPLRAATTWGNSGVEITCESCLKVLRAAGLDRYRCKGALLNIRKQA